MASSTVRVVDWAALAVLAFEVPSFLFSQYRANSASTVEAIAVAVLVYILIRIQILTPLQAGWMAGIVAIGGSWLAALSLRQFAGRAEKLADAGLTDVVAFRSQLAQSIQGWVPGEGFTVLLQALAFACATTVYIWRTGRHKLSVLTLVAPTLVAIAIPLSLSRAVFWSTVLFFLVACALMIGYRIITLKAGALLLAVVPGFVLLIVVCESALFPGIFTAYTGHHATQVRSAQGRLGIWNRSLEVMRQHPLWGMGSSNAALFLLSTADQEETTGFASRPFSLPIQILVEKGIIGFGLYALFVVLVGYEFHRTMRSGPQKNVPQLLPSNGKGRINPPRKQQAVQFRMEAAHKAMKCCFAAGLMAVLFRELTYSSLMEHVLTLALAFALAALACGEVGATA